jgi:hypothetical protein
MISTPQQEGVYQASKWLKLPMLLDGSEIKQLFDALAPFWIFPLTGIVDGLPISLEHFAAEYSCWIEGLKLGKTPRDEELRSLLACAFTDDVEALWLQKVERGFLSKIRKPVVQVQAHFFSYSPVDGEFRSMSMGPESVFWGLLCSFPQVYQDPKTMEICETTDCALFRKIQLWARENTRATPFLVEDKKINAPMRLGKSCFSWINNHPQLRERGLCIHTN